MSSQVTHREHPSHHNINHQGQHENLITSSDEIIMDNAPESSSSLLRKEDHHHHDNQRLPVLHRKDSKPPRSGQGAILSQAGYFSQEKLVYVYMGLFFGAMVGQEVALEAASTTFAELDALANAATCFQFLFCVLLPLAISKGQGLKDLPKTPREILPYVGLSLLVFGATGLATRAVKYVTYPTKVIFKSAKLIPTMLVATVWQGKRYGRVEYLAAALLCGGAAGYSYGTGNKTSSGAARDSSMQLWGIALLVTSIFCDAIVPNYQKLLMTNGVPAGQLMINVNVVGALGIFGYMLLTGQLMDVIEACQTHPRLLIYLTCVGVGMSSAVWAYTKLIQATTSVVAVTVATLRKVATIILSYVLFPKPILTIHIFSSLLVFAGMILSSAAKEGLLSTTGKR